jgi:hypothetical protein
MPEFGRFEGVVDRQLAGSLARRDREVKDAIGGSRRLRLRPFKNPISSAYASSADQFAGAGLRHRPDILVVSHTVWREPV